MKDERGYSAREFVRAGSSCTFLSVAQRRLRTLFRSSFILHPSSLLLVLALVVTCLIPFRTAAQVQSAPSAKARELPNVVLIILDACRADRVHAERNGLPVMPYLAQLSESCVRFTHAVAPATCTRPSMSSLFTALYEETHQVYSGTDALPETFETMASFLDKAGYLTCSVQTNGNLTRALGFAQGFDQYDFLSATDAVDVTNRALEIVPTLTEPFFLYLHYMDTHPPFTPPQSYRTLFGFPDPQLDPAEQAVAEDFLPYFWDQVDYRFGLKPARELPMLSSLGKEAVRTLYDGGARYEDEEMGRVLDAIQAQFPSTFVIIIADHGEHLWEQDWLGHGTTMYEAVLRVPFYIKGPGLQPQTVDANVCTISILPTLAALLGLPARPAWQTRSLFAPRDPLAPVFSRTPGTAPPRDVDIEMVKVGSTKLIRDRRANRLELYDVTADPQEATNLASLRPQQVDALKALLETRREQNIQARGHVQRQSAKLNPAPLAKDPA